MNDADDVSVDPLPHTEREDYLDRVADELIEARLDASVRKVLFSRFGAPEALFETIGMLASLPLETRRAFLTAVVNRGGISGPAIVLAARTLLDGADPDAAVNGVALNQDRAQRILAAIEDQELPSGTLRALLDDPLPTAQANAYVRMLIGLGTEDIPEAIRLARGLGTDGCTRMLESTLQHGSRLRADARALLPEFEARARPETAAPPMVKAKARGMTEFERIQALRCVGRFGSPHRPYIDAVLADTRRLPNGLATAIEAARLQDDMDAITLALAIAKGDPKLAPERIVHAVKALPATGRDVLARDVQRRAGAIEVESTDVPVRIRAVPLSIDVADAFGAAFHPGTPADFLRVALALRDLEPTLPEDRMVQLIEQIGRVQRQSAWSRVRDRIRPGLDPEGAFSRELRARILETIDNDEIFADRQLEELLFTPMVVPEEPEGPTEEAKPARGRGGRSNNVSPSSRGH